MPPALPVVGDSLKLCTSEANERYINFNKDIPSSLQSIIIWGDDKAIQSAITQILMNAIKYAKGSTYITIRIEDALKEVSLYITNYGSPIDEDEKKFMWDFGFRGKRALEMHVNGSGIGLYTVKKIIDAHAGRVGSSVSMKSDNIVTFFFSIPKQDILKKMILLQ